MTLKMANPVFLMFFNSHILVYQLNVRLSWLAILCEVEEVNVDVLIVMVMAVLPSVVNDR